MKKHVQKEHVENEEIDEFAVALGLRLGLPVTPSVIGQLLVAPSQMQKEPPPSDMDSEVSISHVLPGISNLVNPVLFNTRLAQPTTFIDPANGNRVNSRPSDDQIANLVIGLAPSAPGKHFTLEDDVRIIRLKEIEALRWADIAEHFPGREWNTLQKRYATKLTKIVKDHRPDEVTVKMLRGQSSGDNWTREEDLVIIKGKEIDHLFWSEIAKLLPSRTADTVKSRYFRALRPQLRQTFSSDSHTLVAAVQTNELSSNKLFEEDANMSGCDAISVIESKNR